MMNIMNRHSDPAAHSQTFTEAARHISHQSYSAEFTQGGLSHFGFV